MKHRFALSVLAVAGTILVMLATPLDAETGPPLTLAQALEIAFQHSPALAVSRNDVLSAQAVLKQALADYLPQISASTQYDRKRTNADTTLRGYTPESDNYAASLSFTQYIYDFGKTGGQVEKSRQSLAAARQALAAARAGLKRDVQNAFFETLKQQRLVEVNTEAWQVRKRHLAQAVALYRQGLRPKIDTLRGEAEVSQARLQLVQAEYAQRRALAGLTQLLGQPAPPRPYHLVEEMQIPPKLSSLDKLTATAVRRRPDLAQVASQIKAAQADQQALSKDFWPALNARGSYQFAGQEFPLDESWSVGMVFKWDLFTGWRKTGRLDQASAELARLQAVLKSRELDLWQEVNTAYLAVKEAEEATKTATTALKQAKENLAQAEGRYTAGVGTALELSDAQLLYTQTRGQLVQLAYDHLKALANLEYAVGGDPAEV